MKSGKLVVAAVALLFLAIAGGIAAILYELRTEGSNPAIYAMWVPPGMVPEALPDPNGPGAKLVVKYCTHCHALPWPAMHTAEDWPRLVHNMLARIDARMMKPPPTPTPREERELILYLQTYARDPSTPPLRAPPPPPAAALAP